MYPATVGGSVDAFLTILDASQPPFSPKALVYSSYITGPGTQVAYSVDVDPLGSIYVSGITTSDVFPNAIPQNTFVLKPSVFLMIFTLP